MKEEVEWRAKEAKNHRMNKTKNERERRRMTRMKGTKKEQPRNEQKKRMNKEE